MGSDGDGDDCESLATLLAVAIAAFAKRKTHTTHTVVENEDSHRLRHIVVDARGRRNRVGRQPSPREAYTVVDSILPVWFCTPKIHLIFGFGYFIIRDVLRTEKQSIASEIIERNGYEQ